MIDWIKKHIIGYSKEERAEHLRDLIAGLERLKKEAPDKMPSSWAVELIRQFDAHIEEAKRVAAEMGLDLSKDETDDTDKTT